MAVSPPVRQVLLGITSHSGKSDAEVEDDWWPAMIEGALGLGSRTSGLTLTYVQGFLC